MASIDKKYDFGTIKKWMVDDNNKIEFPCGNNTLHRFCELSLQAGSPRELCVGQLYRDEDYSGPADDTLGPLYLYLYGVVRYTHTKSGKQQIHDLFHVLMPFKDFHDLFTQYLIPQVTKYAGDEGIDAATATEDELVPAISASYNTFLTRLVNGEFSAAMQLGMIEFLTDYRFVAERHFSYVGVVSERYPRMTPVFPLLLVQSVLGNWEGFTDSEAEGCNPAMSSTAVSDEEEEVIEQDDEPTGIDPKQSPLEQSPLMEMNALDEIMDEINAAQIAKKLDFTGAGEDDQADRTRPPSPVLSAEGSTSSPNKPPAEEADDAAEEDTAGADGENKVTSVVEGERMDDGSLAPAPEAEESELSKVDSVKTDATEPLDKQADDNTAMNVDGEDTTGAVEEDNKDGNGDKVSPPASGSKRGRPKAGDNNKGKKDQQQLGQLPRREGLRSKTQTTVAVAATNVPDSTETSAEKRPRDSKKSKNAKKSSNSGAKANKKNGRKSGGRRSADEESDAEESSDGDESDTSTEVERDLPVSRTTSTRKRGAAAASADNAQEKPGGSNKQPRANESGAKQQAPPVPVVVSVPQQPRPAVAPPVNPPPAHTNAVTDNQFVTKAELERIVNNSVSHVLDMFLSKGYFANNASSSNTTTQPGFQQPLAPPPPSANKPSMHRPHTIGSGNGKAGAAGGKTKAKIAFGRQAPPGGPSCSAWNTGPKKPQPAAHQKMQPSQQVPYAAPPPLGQVAPTVYKFQFVMGSNNSLGHLEASAGGHHHVSGAYSDGYSQPQYVQPQTNEEGDEEDEEDEEEDGSAMEEEM